MATTSTDCDLAQDKGDDGDGKGGGSSVREGSAVRRDGRDRTVRRRLSALEAENTRLRRATVDAKETIQVRRRAPVLFVVAAGHRNDAPLSCASRCFWPRRDGWGVPTGGLRGCG